MAQHYYSPNPIAVALSAAMGTGDTTIQVPESATDNNWPVSQGYPFTLALDFGTINVELVDVTSKGGLAGSVRTWNVTRAQDLTVASAHAANVANSIRHVISRRDLIEARQARSLQPSDAALTYVIAETTNNVEFIDSTAGDLIYKAAAGKRHRFGVADLPTTLLHIGSVEGIVTQQVPLTAGAGFRRGLTASAFGTNYILVQRTTGYNLADSTWTDLGYNSTINNVSDNGTIYTSPNFISQQGGFYVFQAVVTFSGASGQRGLRFVTQGGTILAELMLPAATIGSNPMSVMGATYLPGGGYTIKAQVYQQGGGTPLAMVAHSTAAPSTCNFAQLL